MRLRSTRACVGCPPVGAWRHGRSSAGRAVGVIGTACSRSLHPLAPGSAEPCARPHDGIVSRRETAQAPTHRREGPPQRRARVGTPRLCRLACNVSLDTAQTLQRRAGISAPHAPRRPCRCSPAQHHEWSLRCVAPLCTAGCEPPVTITRALATAAVMFVHPCGHIGVEDASGPADQAALVKRRVTGKRRSRSACSATPWPGPGATVIWPFCTGGTPVTRSWYQVL